MKLVNKLDPHVEYVFRHIPPSEPSASPNFLSAYGVSLDLKKMDYLALDDRNLGKRSHLVNIMSFNTFVSDWRLFVQLRGSRPGTKDGSCAASYTRTP